MREAVANDRTVTAVGRAAAQHRRRAGAIFVALSAQFMTAIMLAAVAFLFLNGQALATATRLAGAMRAMAVLAGGVGLVFVALMVVGDAGNAAAFGPIGHGGTERMIVYPVMLWLVAFGGALLGSDVASASSGLAAGE